MIRRYLEQLGGNRTVMAVSIARLGDAIGNSILFIVIPIYVAKLPADIFKLPETVKVGILIATFGLITALLQPFMGAFSDWVGKRKIFILGGLILMFISSLGFIFAVQFFDLLILRFIQAIGVALTVPAAVALLASSSKKHSRGGSMGIYTTFRMLGLAIGPLLGGFVYERKGFNVAFIVGAGFILVGVLLVQFWVKDLPSEKPQKQKNPQKPFRIFDTSILSPGLLGAGLASLVMAASFSMITTLENQFNARLSQTAFAFGLAFSSLTISRMITQIPLGRWSDIIGRKPLIITGLIFMMPATIILGYVTSTLQLSLARIVQGMASACVAAPAFAVAADLSSGGNVGRKMSIITVSFGLGIGLGPLLSGILAVHSFQLPFLVIGSLNLLAAVFVWIFLPETAPQKTGDAEPSQYLKTNREFRESE